MQVAFHNLSIVRRWTIL